MLFHFTAQYAPQGDIGKYTDKRLAAALDWSGPVQRLIESLTTTGWVDFDKSTRLVVHDWGEHADRTTQQRLARNGQKPVVPDHIDTRKLCTKVESVSNSTHGGTVAPALALPEPVPEPASSPAPLAKVNGHAEYPAILAEIRKHDAAADDHFARRLYGQVVQFCLSSPKFPQQQLDEITDESVARCVAESYRTGPPGHGTGLLLNRVPNIVLTWSLES